MGKYRETVRLQQKNVYKSRSGDKFCTKINLYSQSHASKRNRPLKNMLVSGEGVFNSAFKQLFIWSLFSFINRDLGTSHVYA